jgi:hypothetical protein
LLLLLGSSLLLLGSSLLLLGSSLLLLGGGGALLLLGAIALLLGGGALLLLGSTLALLLGGGGALLLLGGGSETVMLPHCAVMPPQTPLPSITLTTTGSFDPSSVGPAGTRSFGDHARSETGIGWPSQSATGTGLIATPAIPVVPSAISHLSSGRHSSSASFTHIVPHEAGCGPPPHSTIAVKL